MSSIDSSINGLIAAQQSQINSNIRIAVAVKQLDSYRQQGEAVNSLLDVAVQFSKESGKGAQLDSIA